MSSPDKYLHQSFEEILFERRNKEYGSYLLRGLIPSNLRRGLILTTAAAVIALVLMSVDLHFGNKKIEVSYSNIEITLSDPPPLYRELPPAVPPTAKKIESAELTEMEVKKDNEVTEPEKEITETPSDTTTNGTAAQGTSNDSQMSGDGNTIYARVDKNPEYPGGISKYLRDNLEYPKIARENNIQGSVDLVFVVNTDGSVSDVQVLKPLGGGCDQEAVRVISQMKRWKPGIRGGVPVRVYQRTTIKFNLEG